MRRLIFLLVTSLSLSAPVLAAPPRQQGMAVDYAWSRPAAAGTNGAGFMTLSNRGKRADTLISIESAAAARVEVHQTSIASGVMSMRHLTTGLPLGPGQAVMFAPGGYHLMFVNLANGTRVGESISAVLIFKSGIRLPVTFPVMSGQAGHR